MPVKTKTALSQAELNTVKQTPYLELKSRIEETTKAEILEGRAVVVIDPLTGKALGASDFFKFPVQQTDAYLDQNNPVSAQNYPVLTSIVNARLISIVIYPTWTVQPGSMNIIITVDSIARTYTIANPASVTKYFPTSEDGISAMTAVLGTTQSSRAFIYEGKLISITASITGGTVQNLKCRAIYALWQ